METSLVSFRMLSGRSIPVALLVVSPDILAAASGLNLWDLNILNQLLTNENPVEATRFSQRNSSDLRTTSFPACNVLAGSPPARAILADTGSVSERRSCTPL